MKFDAGKIYLSREVNDMVAANEDFAKFVHKSLARHLGGDWGEMEEEDKQTNEEALLAGLRLFSAYETKPLEKIWIITEADRSVTTVLLPSEY